MSGAMDMVNDAKDAIKANDHARAQHILEEAVRAAPDSRDVHALLGVVYAETGEADLAVAELRRALALDPDHLTTLRNLARVLEQQGRVTEAIDVVEHALSLDPADGDTKRVRGRLQQKADRARRPPARSPHDVVAGYCPICETPIPRDTERRTCDLCGVSLVPLLKGRVIPEPLADNEQRVICSRCGAEVTDYKVMRCSKCGHDFLSGQAPSDAIGTDALKRGTASESGTRTHLSSSLSASPAPDGTSRTAILHEITWHSLLWVPPLRRASRYPVLRLYQYACMVTAWLLLTICVILAFVALFGGWGGALARGDSRQERQEPMLDDWGQVPLEEEDDQDDVAAAARGGILVMSFLMAFAFLFQGCMWFASIRAIVEIIQVYLDIEDNTRNAAEEATQTSQLITDLLDR